WAGGHPKSEPFDNVKVGEEMAKLAKKELDSAILQEILRGIGLLSELQKTNKDFAYHGKTVGPDDKDKVLLRWKWDDKRCQVIFGARRAEVVPPEKLREREGKYPGAVSAAPPRERGTGCRRGAGSARAAPRPAACRATRGPPAPPRNPPRTAAASRLART